MKIFISIILFIAVIFSFGNILDKDIYQFSRLEADRNFTRQEYLGEGLGKIYKNRFGIVFFSKTYPSLMKFESNFFLDLDNPVIFISLFGLFVYLGYKKYQ